MIQCIRHLFFRKLSACLQPNVYLAGEYVFKHGDISTNMHFIAMGQAQVFVHDRRNDIENSSTGNTPQISPSHSRSFSIDSPIGDIQRARRRKQRTQSMEFSFIKEENQVVSDYDDLNKQKGKKTKGNKYEWKKKKTLLTTQQKNQHMTTILTECDYFGEIGLVIPQQTRTASILALTVLETFTLSVKDWRKLLYLHPDATEDIIVQLITHAQLHYHDIYHLLRNVKRNFTNLFNIQKARRKNMMIKAKIDESPLLIRRTIRHDQRLINHGFGTPVTDITGGDKPNINSTNVATATTTSANDGRVSRSKSRRRSKRKPPSLNSSRRSSMDLESIPDEGALDLVY